LGGEDKGVEFVDMAALGRNPACIIPAWRDFVDRQTEGRPVRGIGEPIWAGRSPAELVECQRHECLLNLAFDDTPAFWLLCPYDTQELPDDVLDEARRSHPLVAQGRASRSSAMYVDPDQAPGPFDGHLTEPACRPAQLTFGKDQIRAVRSFVSDQANGFGLNGSRGADLVLAVSELTTNTVVHAGGNGIVRVWKECDSLLCEVRDDGRLEYPLVGRERPTPDRTSGRGLWLVNHLCDLVQIRSQAGGNVVRLHMRIGDD
jgi:anti-sigma regulatory factor (Ser/Thr protein kinase)